MCVSLTLVMVVAAAIVIGCACYRRGFSAGKTSQPNNDPGQYDDTTTDKATSSHRGLGDDNIDQDNSCVDSTYEVIPDSQYEEPVPTYLQLKGVYEDVM